MSSKRSVLLSGVVAALIAAALIAASVSVGVLNLTRSNTNSGNLTTFALQPSNSVGGSSQSNSGSGTLAVLMTDPPTIPSGVTQVYVTYNDLAIHIASAGNNTGWYDLKTSGQIDLMSIINITQTVASVKVSSGVFNAIAFNVTSATVTFESKNYSAELVYDQHILVAWISGGITIDNGQTSAAVIDMTPTVLLLGTPQNPTFAFIPAAQAYALPAQSVSTQSLHTVGTRQNIAGAEWWRNIQTNTHFDITNIQLTANSISITVANTGKNTIYFKLAAVTSTVFPQGGFKVSLPSIAALSELFVVEPNSTLSPLTSYNKVQLAQSIEDGGYLLPPHATVTFVYSGVLTIGLLQPVNANGQTLQATRLVVPGQRYIVTILAVGGGTAKSLVVAG